VAVGVAVAVGISGTAAAAGDPKPTVADVAFLKQASQSNRFEIASSEVAAQLQQRQSRSAPAKSLGTTANVIATAHRKAQTRLGAVEKQLSIQVSNRPDPLQQFLVSQLAAFAASTATTVIGAGSKAGPSEGGNNGEGASGKYAPTPNASAVNSISAIRLFYLRMQVATHQLAIARYSSVAASTKNSAIRKFACQSLPMLESHLRLVEQAIGSATTATTTNSNSGSSSSSDSSSANSTSSNSSSSSSGSPAIPAACSNG
jgi:hypothetical protein